jgi:trk system potassium uptake protein TrkH
LFLFARYAGRRLPDDVPASVLAFLAVYIGTIGLFTLVLSAMGLDLVTALSSAVQAIGNVGPGLGPVVGPAGNYASLPDAAKWVLSTAMLMGRLELFTLLVLLDPDFWVG